MRGYLRSQSVTPYCQVEAALLYVNHQESASIRAHSCRAGAGAESGNQLHSVLLGHPHQRGWHHQDLNQAIRRPVQAGKGLSDGALPLQGQQPVGILNGGEPSLAAGSLLVRVEDGAEGANPRAM